MLPIAVAQRQLHALIIELALDALPFLQYPAIAQNPGEQPERFGGFPDQGHRIG